MPVLPRAAKRPIAIVIDGVLLLAATWIAFSLRLDTLHRPQGAEWAAYAAAVTIALPVFSYFGLYRTIYRYSGMGSLVDIAQAVLVYACLYALALFWFKFPGVPRTLSAMQPVLALVLVGAWRIGVRLWFGRGGLRAGRLQRQRVLIYGAGAAGRRLMAALQNSPEMLVVGFVDDDRSLQGSSINGLPIYGLHQLTAVVDRRHITDVLLAIPSLSRARRNEILNELRQSAVHVRTLPGLMDLAQGKVQATDVRELEIEDLLGREPVQPSQPLMARHNAGKVVLVTGAGGSIGSELCRQILGVQPRRVLLLDQSEFALYSIHQELCDKIAQGVLPSCELVPLLCSVRDEARVADVMQCFRPDIVYHAAAYKHVPLVEHNLVEGARNNVLGTLVAARAAVRAGVPDFVLISTDKAVRPTNVMGATKRLAEMVLQALAHGHDIAPGLRDGRPVSTCFSMVRFGNVLGSSGSVVPLFRQQIRNGGPVTLTHPDVTRFFMTIPEAAQLVVQAGALARGGEVFVLDMGSPVLIADLARRMIELSGLTVRDESNPDGEIEIVLSGLRPGEKLYEELLIGNNPLPTVHPRILMANEAMIPWAELKTIVKGVSTLAERGDVQGLRDLLAEVVTGYVPSDTIVDWTYMADASRQQDRGAAANA